MFESIDIFLINIIFIIPLLILAIYIFCCSNVYISFPKQRILKQKEKYTQRTYDWAKKEMSRNHLQSINLAIRLFSTINTYKNSSDNIDYCYQKRKKIEQNLSFNKNKKIVINSIAGSVILGLIIFVAIYIPVLNANMQYNNKNYTSAYYGYNYSFISYSNENFIESSYQYAVELFEEKQYEASEKILSNIPTNYKETEKYSYYITAIHHLNSHYIVDHDPCMAYEYIDYCIKNYDGIGDSYELMKSNYYLSSINKMQGDWYFDNAKNGVAARYKFRRQYPDFETKIFKIVGSKFDGTQIVSEYGNGYKVGEKDKQLFYIDDMSFEFDGKDTIIIEGAIYLKKK